MSIIVLVLLALLLSWSTASAELTASTPGDAILGGLFAIHENDGHDQCGSLRASEVIQRVEAVLFVLDQINNDSTILPGLTLGAKIMDTCDTDARLFRQAQSLARTDLNSANNDNSYQCADGSTPRLKPSGSTPPPIVGVAGPSLSHPGSVTSKQVISILQDVGIPRISPSTSNHHAAVLADVIQHFNWTYVSFVYSGDEYGERGLKAFQRAAKARHICTAALEKLSVFSTYKMYDTIVENVKRKDRAKVIVIFAGTQQTEGFLSAAARANLESDGFVLLIADQFRSRNVAPIIMWPRTKRSTEFEAYFSSLHPGNPLFARNPWLLEFWETKFRCKIQDIIVAGLRANNPLYSEEGNQVYQWRKDTWNDCAEDLRLQADSNGDAILGFMDTIKTFAKGLDALLRADCKERNTSDPCDKLKVPPSINTTRLHQYILSVSFSGFGEHEVQFSSQDGFPKYDVYQESHFSHSSSTVFIGEWRKEKFTITRDDRQLHWPPNYRGTSPPRSVCSEPCRAGYKKVIQDDTCCWMCAAE